VELARVLVEQGENARAAEVCQQGLVHHPDSIHGYVLWGKALIGLGRPAEAMEQFDKAVAVDRQDPLAYHLISEVLVGKGLYRSALPLLRKAVALSPADEQVKIWLEQTQGALAGGPAPPCARGAGQPARAPLTANGTATGAIPVRPAAPAPPSAASGRGARRGGRVHPAPERKGSGSFPPPATAPPRRADRLPASADATPAARRRGPSGVEDVTEPSLLADVPERRSPPARSLR
jgi:tetratricopeptide (TPR) repeat protein